MSVQNEKQKGKDELEDFVLDNHSMIRSCWDYEIDYKECKSLRGRFQQNFLFGEFTNCEPYKMRLRYCEKCEKGDFSACAYVIDEEKKLRDKRIQTRMENDVWKKRKEPPPDWNAELPDWLKAKQKNSYLSDTPTSCIIS